MILEFLKRGVVSPIFQQGQADEFGKIRFCGSLPKNENGDKRPYTIDELNEIYRKNNKQLFCLNPNVLYDKYRVMILDFDINDIYIDKSSELGIIVDNIINSNKYCYTVSKKNRINLYIPCITHRFIDKDTKEWNFDNGKIEILHKSTHHLVYGINNVPGYQYYTRHNVENLLEMIQETFSADYNEETLNSLVSFLNNVSIEEIKNKADIDTKEMYRKISKSRRDIINSSSKNEPELDKKDYNTYLNFTNHSWVSDYLQKQRYGDGNRTSWALWVYSICLNNPYITFEQYQELCDYLDKTIGDFIVDSKTNQNRISNSNISKFESKIAIEIPKNVITPKNRVTKNNTDLENLTEEDYIGLDFTGREYRLYNLLVNRTYKECHLIECKDGGYEYIFPEKKSNYSQYQKIATGHSGNLIEVFDTTKPDEVLYKKDGVTYFNTYANLLVKDNLRQEWIEDNKVYNSVKLNKNTEIYMRNILGKNFTLFLDKEAYVLATLNKVKGTDIICSGRSIGKSTFINMLTKIKLPECLWDDSLDFQIGAPQMSNKRVQFSELREDTLSIVLEEAVNFSEPLFHYLKELQSPMGISVTGKGVKARNIKNKFIQSYILFNPSTDLSNSFYYSNSKEYKVSMCYSRNEDSVNIYDLDVDLDYLASDECLVNLKQWLYARYTNMSESRKKDIIKNYALLSAYDMSKDFQPSDVSKTEDYGRRFVDVLKSKDINKLEDFLNDAQVMQYISKNRSSVSRDASLLIGWNIEDSEGKFKYKDYKTLKTVFGIGLSTEEVSNLFTNRMDRGVWKYYSMLDDEGF